MMEVHNVTYNMANGGGIIGFTISVSTRFATLASVSSHGVNSRLLMDGSCPTSFSFNAVSVIAFRSNYFTRCNTPLPSR